MSETAVYLYAITDGLDSRRLVGRTGVSATPLRTVCAAGGEPAPVAVVSTVSLGEFGEQPLRDHLEDLEWLEQTARAHHAVVETVAGLAATAPVRLATVFHDDDRVSELLTTRRPDIEAALASVRGRAEWGVKVYSELDPMSADPGPVDPGPVDPGPVDPKPVGPQSAGGGSRPGTAYLRRRRDQRHDHEEAMRRLVELTEWAHTRLSAYAVAERQHQPQDPTLSGQRGLMLLNIAYLIDDPRSTDFVATTDELAAQLDGLRIEVTGPWPAYSFVTIEEDP